MALFHVTESHLAGFLNADPETVRQVQQARRPEPIERALEAVDPVRALLTRLRDKVMPLIEQQRDPSQRRVLLAALEGDLRDAFKVLGELESELREIRERCAGLWKTARKLRPKRKPRRGEGREARPACRPSQPPTEEEKQAVREALRKRGVVAMSELCHLTGFIMFRVRRVLHELGMEGKVERFGERSGTRYRWTGEGRCGEEEEVGGVGPGS